MCGGGRVIVNNKYNIGVNKKEENGAGKTKLNEVSSVCVENHLSDFNKKMFYENQIGCKWYSSSEASAFLSISENALRILVYRGQIPFYKFGRRLRFKADDLLNLFKTKGF